MLLTAPSMSTWLQSALNNAETVVKWCWDFIVGNELLQMLLIISIIPVGFYIFSRAKSAVGGGAKDE